MPTNRKQKKIDDTYTWRDFIWNVFACVPELLLYAFRLLRYVIHGIIKLFTFAN
ncbi:hypothetical protein MUG87_02200 [Ectobacillus sp. JY-23]|uniref:hypothetical protein n=1 Tax=Ectobacillus sp. JY-23 TaxID=2933872 RepID=UPI001FF4A9E7|nr:hypothetical protein [Ectobacillus sp. JY-23]UOY92971.1 hypothetical protein MUG87_02200 [Ectobacillus sp. JY-23]